MNHEQARAIIAPFYDVLNQPASKNVAGLVHTATTADWRSYSNEGVSKGRDEFIQQMTGFGKAIPNLAWDIREILVAGDRVIVRSEATGTPAGPFFAVPHGGRSFRVMAIDIHLIRDGNIAVSHHVEDWAGALQQLSVPAVA